MIGRWFRYKLAPDYHVSIEGVAYLVPYRLIGKNVDVFRTVSLVSIFHKASGSRPMPARMPNWGGSVTLDEHRPPNHRAAALLTPEAIRAEAVGLGGALVLLADRDLRRCRSSRPGRAPGRRTAAACQLHGTVALQAAATAALSANVRSYRFVQHLLAKGRIDALEDPAGGVGPHANRGPAYYH